MRVSFSSLFVIAATSVCLASAAAAAEPAIKVPPPPAPKIVVPKPPAPKVKIDAAPTSIKKGAGPSRRYEYYPDAEVYFDPARRLYFFMEANRWAARAFLPPQIKLRIGSPIVIELGTEQPYEYHNDVRRVHSGRHDERGRSYRAGFNDGYEEGYRDGFNAGFREGFDQGYRDGYRSGYRDGRHDDYPPGRDRGKKEGW